MSEGGWEQIAANKSTATPKPCLDAVVVEDREGNRGFSDSRWTDESDRFEVLGEFNNLLDQAGASETGPWSWGRRFSGGNTAKRSDRGLHCINNR